MPRAVAVPVRQALLRRWQHGQTAIEMASALGLAPRTVRHLLAQFRDGRIDLQALSPAYARCGWHRRWRNQLLFQSALEMRRQHPSWGSGLIWVFLKERWHQQPLPTERTLQRWFDRAGLGPAPRGRRPSGPHGRANRPHERWEMDAVERVRLSQGQEVSWLRLTDECSGAILHTKVFPVGRWSHVGASAVQAELRKAFTRWGRPQMMRVDNGAPWGSTGGLPTALALWLLGLNVPLIWNRPHQPRDNAVVERTQGVSERWVEAHTCADVRELQRRLDRMDRIHRDRYPSREGQSRTEAYPRLAHSGRLYNGKWEFHHWSLQRVLQGLAEYAVPRQVDRSGKVWLYDQSHGVGKARAGQQLYVTLDPEARAWVFQDRDGREVQRQPARQLTKERICHLNVGRTGTHS
jgi:hypothetical protein